MKHASAGARFGVIPATGAVLGALISFACTSKITDASDGSMASDAAGGKTSPSASAGGKTSPSASAGGTSSNGQGGSSNVAGADATPPAVQGQPSAEVCPSVEVPSTALRRLTRFEYANSVKLLLGVDTSAVSDLPADEVTDGFDNNAALLTVSSLHAEKYTLVSESLAKLAVANASLVACDNAKKTEDACALDFAKSFGRRAFRRPITSEDETFLLAAYKAGKDGGTHAEGIEVMIRAALQSPDFLYRLELTAPASPATKLVPLSQFELATRLSFLIWGSGPDDALLDAAARGELGSRETVAARAKAMLADPKARVAIANFYNQWAGTSRLTITTKNTALFPLYSGDVKDALARELPSFIEYVLFGADHKLSTLLTSSVGFVSAPLAKIYGVPAPTGATPQMVTFPSDQGRSGLLTQASFLAVQAHPDQTSPVLRGKFIRTKLLCQPPPPPPPDVEIKLPDASVGGTARDRFGAHLTTGSTCNGCHTLMDPIGYAFENFDALGQYRTKEAGQTIDASGEVLASPDPALGGKFMGVRELANKLVNSDLVRDCLTTQFFRFAAGRNEAPGDACSLSTLQERFASSGGDLNELVIGLTQTDAFFYRSP